MSCQIEEVITSLNVPNEKIRKLSPSESIDVRAEVENNFVVGKPRVWWLSLIGELKITSAQDDLSHLTNELIPKCDRYYFIPDEGINVFEGGLDSIKRVLEECSFIEYYITSFDFSWLFCETDHSECIWVRR